MIDAGHNGAFPLCKETVLVRCAGSTCFCFPTFSGIFASVFQTAYICLPYAAHTIQLSVYPLLRLLRPDFVHRMTAARAHLCAGPKVWRTFFFWLFFLLVAFPIVNSSTTNPKAHDYLLLASAFCTEMALTTASSS